eukprot:7954541-Alexandrium_andersonii.AAC.1
MCIRDRPWPPRGTQPSAAARHPRDAPQTTACCRTASTWGRTGRMSRARPRPCRPATGEWWAAGPPTSGASP